MPPWEGDRGWGAALVNSSHSSVSKLIPILWWQDGISLQTGQTFTNSFLPVGICPVLHNPGFLFLFFPLLQWVEVECFHQVSLIFILHQGLVCLFSESPVDLTPPESIDVMCCCTFVRLWIANKLFKKRVDEKGMTYTVMMLISLSSINYFYRFSF